MSYYEVISNSNDHRKSERKKTVTENYHRKFFEYENLKIENQRPYDCNWKSEIILPNTIDRFLLVSPLHHVCAWTHLTLRVIQKNHFRSLFICYSVFLQWAGIVVAFLTKIAQKQNRCARIEIIIFCGFQKDGRELFRGGNWKCKQWKLI